MVEQIEPIQVGQIQGEPGITQQCEFKIEVITPWLYKLVIEEDYRSGTSKYRNLQKISYWCYYYIHLIHGQIQIELSTALAHLKAYRSSGGVGWQLPNQAPNVPLQPMVPLVICEKPRRRIGC